MGLTVVFVSGPRCAGKSAFLQQVIHSCSPPGPHYLRLTVSSGEKAMPVGVSPPDTDCGVSSARWLCYDENSAFEVIPSALERIHRDDRHGLVMIEADSDPILRYAYPYDVRAFVVPAPRKESEVFRSSAEATAALQEALNDTAVFAREIYGLADAGSESDLDKTQSSQPRSAVTAAQIRALINTPLGDELATRILLSPSHHGLLESDFVVVNTGTGGTSGVVDDCVGRLERVLGHLRVGRTDRPLLYACDLYDADDPLRQKLISRFCEGIGRTAGRDVTS